MDGFMRSYARSALVHAAVKRIGRMHGGDVPKDAEGLWKQAMAVQKAADEADRRADALCGPECLAELMRRRGRASRKATHRAGPILGGTNIRASTIVHPVLRVMVVTILVSSTRRKA